MNRVLQVDASGSPTENCASLREVLASIDDSDHLNRYLVRLEPGAYDCGAQPVVVGEYVGVEGAGRTLTEVRGTVDNNFFGVLHLNGSFASVRALSLLNVQDAPTQAAIGISIWKYGSSDTLFGVELQDLQIGGAPGATWSVYSSNANYVARNVRFNLPLHNAGGGAAGLSYSLVPAVEGGGTFRCIFCSRSSGAELDSTCQLPP